MAKVTIPAAGQYGLIADQPPQELPINAFSRVENMRFRDGCAERFEGELQIFDTPAVTPYWVGPYATATKRYWIHAGLAAVYADDGTTRTDITGSAPTGAIDDRWTGGVLNGVFFLNNGVDNPMYWDGNTANNLATLPGWNSAWKAKSMGSFKNYLVALNITKSSTAYPYMVKWSDAADPGAAPASWDETDATKTAGEQDLAETPGLFVDQLILGDANILYKEDSMYAMRFIGGTQIFEFRKLPGSFGMLTRGCAANTPKGHVVLANGDLVIHQGIAEPQSLLTARLKRWLFQTQIDSTNYRRCFVFSNPTKSEVWICYPEYGESTCTRALVWNWDDNTFGSRDLSNVTYAAAGLLDYTAGNTWADYSGVTWADLVKAWNANDYTPADSRVIMATSAPKLLLGDVRSTFIGGNVSAVLERTGIALDDPETVKTITRMIPRIDAVAGTVVSIQFGASMDAEVGYTWSAEIPYTVGTTYKADGFATGRFLAYRITSTGKQPWRVKSMDLYFEPRGKF